MGSNGDGGRDLGLTLMQETSGQSLQEIAGAFGVSGRAAAGIAVRRLKKRLATDKILSTQYDAARRLLTKSR